MSLNVGIVGEVALTITYNRLGADEAPEGIKVMEQETGDTWDLLSLYVNGKEFGKTVYSHKSYDEGLEYWDGNEVPMFVGVCPCGSDDNYYYLDRKSIRY